MKIVAQYNNKSGGGYHRVKLWSEFANNVILTEVLTEELIKDAQVVYVHYSLNKVSVPQLSIWKETYNFKLFVDLDDVWIGVGGFYSKMLCIVTGKQIGRAHV